VPPDVDEVLIQYKRPRSRQVVSIVVQQAFVSRNHSCCRRREVK
jgi:hypothetical protein